MKNFLLLILAISFSIIPAQFQACGRTQFSTSLVINGEEAKPGEFPFLVSLIKKSDQKFFCGASLITKKHALTASHCIQDKKQPFKLKAENIIAKLGKFNLKSNYERGEVTRNISRIIDHEDWNINDLQYDADITLLVFDSEVELSDNIKVICLPESSNANNLIGGQVVGYGLSERSDFRVAEDTPRKTMIKKPPSNEDCFYQDEHFVRVSSKRTFCAGGEKSGPCKGDSGGGFYVQRDSVWYLQGIVSASLANEQTLCDVSKYAIYTNVALYIDWIQLKIGLQLDNRYHQPQSYQDNQLKAVELQCDFTFIGIANTDRYACESKISEIIVDNLVYNSATGKHLAGQDNDDIKLLNLNPDSRTRNIKFIPSGISDLFPILRTLYIERCKIEKISRKNFKGLNEVTTLSLIKNKIYSIDEDTFYEVPKLYWLRLNDNQVTTLPSNLLVTSPGLQIFAAPNNFIKELFGDQLFRNNPKLRTIDMENNELVKIKINWKKNKKLEKIDFRSNICINMRFGYTSKSQSMAALIENLIKKC